MSIEKCLDKMKSVYEGLLNFLDGENNEEINFENLNIIFQDNKTRDDQHDLKLFLHLIISICNNYHRCRNFFDKIDQILKYFKDDIKKYYSNPEIFDIFKSNKRLLLFLVEEKIMNMEEQIVKQIITFEYEKKKYPQYFAPEILPFADKEWFPKSDNNVPSGFGSSFGNATGPSVFGSSNRNESVWFEDIKKDLPANFYENRKKGENDSYICKLIQEDLIKEFITYVNQNNISLISTIKPSIYETNDFLIQKQNVSNSNFPSFGFNQSNSNNSINNGITLIEYAAFFGSIQIFQYLKINGAEMDQKLWLYSIHGKNAEIIHILEERNIEPTIRVQDNNGLGFGFGTAKERKSYKGCFIESIKCNHNDIANYILNNYLQNGDEKSSETIIESIKYYNFDFMEKEEIKNSFCYLYYYEYYSLVKILLLTAQDIKINQKMIQHHIIQ